MSVLVFQGAKDLQSTPEKKEQWEREDYKKMGSDGSHLVCSGAEACKDLKLIWKPHMRPVRFYGHKLSLQEAWWVVNIHQPGSWQDDHNIKCPVHHCYQGAHNANTCSPTSQVRSSLGFIGGEWFNLEFLFIEKLRCRTEHGEEHATDFSRTNDR